MHIVYKLWEGKPCAGKNGHYNLLKDVAGLKYGANDSESFHNHFQSLLDLGNFVLPYYKKLVLELAKLTQ